VSCSAEAGCRDVVTRGIPRDELEELRSVLIGLQPETQITMLLEPLTARTDSDEIG